MFENREEAAVLLSKSLIKYKNDREALIVVILGNDTIVGQILAKELKLSLIIEKVLHESDEIITELKNKTVIIANDGITVDSSIQFIIDILKKSSPKKIIIATPVASAESVEKFMVLVDKVICLKIPPFFKEVKNHYTNNKTVDDKTIVKLLSKKKSVFL